MARYRLIAARPAGSTDEEAVSTVEAVLAEGGRTEVVWLTDGLDLGDLLGPPGDGATPDTVLTVAGGDGTLHLVVQTLYRHGLLAGTTLGLVPLGTGNDLARTLGLPLDPEEAARVVLRGEPRPLDLLVDGHDVVLNAGHAGVGVAAAARASDLKDTLGAAAYATGTALEGVGAEPVELTVEVDGQPVGDGSPLLLVGVGNGTSVGGGTVLFPEADPADGLLDVLTVADRSTWQRLVLALATRRESHLDLDGVAYRRGREVVATGTAAWNDDGELGEVRPGRSLRVEPAAWHLLG